MKAEKGKYFLWAVLLLLVLAFPVTGNAALSKKQVNKSVESFFGYARKLNVGKMEKCFVKQNGKIFQASKAFCKTIRPYCKKMKWKIKSTKISGSKAVVKVRVDFESLEKSYKAAMDAVFENGIGEPDFTVKSGTKTMIKTLKKQLAKNKSRQVYSVVNIRLKKSGGKWKITKPSDLLLNAVYCDYIYTMYHFLYNEQPIAYSGGQ